MFSPFWSLAQTIAVKKATVYLLRVIHLFFPVASLIFSVSFLLEVFFFSLCVLIGMFSLLLLIQLTPGELSGLLEDE